MKTVIADEIFDALSVLHQTDAMMRPKTERSLPIAFFDALEDRRENLTAVVRRCNIGFAQRGIFVKRFTFERLVEAGSEAGVERIKCHRINWNIQHLTPAASHCQRRNK